jgi:ferredoxin/flavodoxin
VNAFHARHVKIVYFTGTGGTKRIAERLAADLNRQQVSVSAIELNGNERLSPEKEDMLVVIYPVYALNAPKPVYDYIRKLQTVHQIPAVVLSVSGGGEVFPNTACRLHSIRYLERKGYRVFYEKMLVMPSNVFVETPDELSAYLLQILPHKVEKIAADIVAGIHHRTKPHIIDRILSAFAEMEKAVSKWFGRRIKVNSSCTGCALCARQCPVQNITMQNGRPHFHDKCTVCLKCIYHCPHKSLEPGIGKAIVLKKGYRLPEINKHVMDAEERHMDAKRVELLAKGYMFSGIKKYLLEE